MNYEGAQFKASPAAIRAVTMGLTVSQTVNGKSTLGSRGYFFRIDNDRSRRTDLLEPGYSKSDGQEISDLVEVNRFCSYFSSIGPILAKKIRPLTRQSK